VRNPSPVAFRSSLRQVDDLDMFESAIEPLTSLYSVALFDEVAEARFSEARRHGIVASLMMVELDDFEGIRARHGRLVADAAMVSVAELLRAVLRREDMMALRGDATFEILLMHCDGVSAHAKAESLCAAIATVDPAGVGATVSAGVAAAVAGPGLRLELLFARATEALAAARARGGNCAMFVSPPHTPALELAVPGH